MTPRPTRDPLAYFPGKDEDLADRRDLLRQAQAGSVTALVDLWRKYHVRLPLVEFRTGWRPE